MMKNFNQNIAVAILYTITLMLFGCSGKVYKLKLQHQGLIECFRLDREPVAEQDCGNDLGDGNLARSNYGNYHRSINQPIASNLFIQSMPQRHLDKLPVSDCLWTAGSQFNNGDRIHLLWDAFASLQIDGEEFNSPNQTNLFSACRFDPAFNRISIFDEPNDQIISDLCFGDSVSLDVDIKKIKSELIKSNCDLNPYGLPLIEHVQPIDPYGQCLDYDESLMNSSMGDRVSVDVDRGLTGWNTNSNQVSGCAGIEGEGLITIKTARDMILSVGDLAIPGTTIPIPETRSLLHPQIMTVIGQRDIARPLLPTSGNTIFAWQGEVLVQGDAGKQKWLENFSENIRVDKVRMFKVTDPINDVRSYIDLNGATLNIYDADDGSMPGVSASCSSDDGTVFDVTACQFNVTPTYQVSNLDNVNLASLSDPLIWQIELASEEQGNLYIEFDLISTYKSSQAAIMVDHASLDLGESLVGKSSNQLIQVTNVGSGSYIIDDVEIDPTYHQAFAFSAERLDDPVMIPYPFYLEPTGKDDEYQTGYQDMSTIDLQLDIREFEDHVTVRPLYIENLQLEIESEAVIFDGYVAVAQSQNPTFDGNLRVTNRIYPFRYPVYQVWDLPYLLKPGEQRSVMVTSHPPYPGEFRGRVDISGYPLHDQNARTTVSVFLDSYGLIGPMVEILPTSLSFPHFNGGANDLGVIVVNSGDSTLFRSSLELKDSVDSMHQGESQNFKILDNPPSTNNINKGSSERINLRYDPGCFSLLPTGSYHRAVLSIKTDIGNYVVPLAGDPVRFVANTPSCQPGG